MMSCGGFPDLSISELLVILQNRLLEPAVLFYFSEMKQTSQNQRGVARMSTLFLKNDTLTQFNNTLCC